MKPHHRSKFVWLFAHTIKPTIRQPIGSSHVQGPQPGWTGTRLATIQHKPYSSGMPVAKPNAVNDPLPSPSNQREDISSSTTVGRSETLRFPPSHATDHPPEGETLTDQSNLLTWSSERATSTSLSEADPEDTAARVGEVIAGRYELQERVAAGAMGVVWRAQDRKLGIPVAVKLVSPQLTLADEATLRLREEASILKRIDSPHVARILDAGQLESGSPYLVTELLRGETLQTVLERRTFVTQAEAVDWIGQAAAGLADVHSAGLVHDDIKPSNLFLIRNVDEPPTVKLLDFGVAHALSARLVDRDRVLGSPWYLAPERLVADAAVDERSDIWSLGVILYELVAGRRPFEGQSLEEVCASVISGVPIALRSWRPDVSVELDGIVSRCLQPRPEDRYPDAGALASELRALHIALGSSLAPTVESIPPPPTDLQPASGFPRPLDPPSDPAQWRPRQLARAPVTRRRWPAILGYVLAGSLVLFVGVSVVLQQLRSKGATSNAGPTTLTSTVRAAPPSQDTSSATVAALPVQSSDSSSENRVPPDLREDPASDAPESQLRNSASDQVTQQQTGASISSDRSAARHAAPAIRAQRAQRVPRRGNPPPSAKPSGTELGIPVDQIHINSRGELVDPQGKPLK